MSRCRLPILIDFEATICRAGSDPGEIADGVSRGTRYAHGQLVFEVAGRLNELLRRYNSAGSMNRGTEQATTRWWCGGGLRGRGQGSPHKLPMDSLDERQDENFHLASHRALAFNHLRWVHVTLV